MHIHATHAPETALPHWVVASVEATGWVVYACALAVLAGMGAAMVIGLAKAAW
ncbi:MAG TPA: hypothetical protein VGE70_05060 [Burkholderiaceae bacterium]